MLQLIVFFGICYSLYTPHHSFSSPRFESSIIPASGADNALNVRTVRTAATVTAIWAKDEKDSENNEMKNKNHQLVNYEESGDIDPEDPYSEGFENQKEWLELFPRKRTPEILREYPDFANLEPNVCTDTV